MEVVEKLIKNPNCFDINILNNPVEQGCSSFNVLVAEILSKQPRMQRFCKVKITDAHRLEAVYLKRFKWGKSEEERKRKLAEDAAKAKEE